MKKLFTLMLALFAMVAIQAQSLLVQDFENGIPSTWLNIDADGDGNSWLSSENTTGVSGHNGSNGCAYSCSYYDGTVLHPDNWLITEAVNLTGASTLTFWVCAQDASYAAEHYGVYISTTGTATSDFTLLFEETIDANGGSRVQGAWKQKTVNLSNYTGQTVRIAFRHFNCSDMFYFNLDDVEIVAAPTTPTIVASQNVDFGIVHLGNNATQQVAVTTYNLTAGVTATVTGPFTISADGNTFGTTANIAQAGGTLYVNYAPTATGNSTGSITLSSTGAPSVTITLAGNCIDCSNTSIPYSCNFTNATQNECWTIVDANNDGSTFIIDENNGYAYYYYNSTNYANDYLISPSFNFTGSQTVMFDYAVAGSSFPEIFEVFAFGSDTVRLTQPTTVTNTTFNTETMNLPNLNGSYSIAIHCISENDRYALIISNFKVLDASSSIVDVTPASITFNTIATGTTDESTFNISTTNLNEIITITTSAPFEVSADGNTYATTITIPADSNYLTSTDVYVRFAPTVGGTFTGVVLVTTPTSSDTIVLNGIGVECNAISTFPFNEDFSATSTSIPCWQVVDANNDGKTFSIANGYASCPYHSTNPADDWLLSPEITFTGNEMGSFEYWCGSTSWSERFEVYAIGADTVLLVNSVDVTNSSSNPQTQYLALSSLTGNYRIGIHCISDANQLRLYIDNFNISAATTTMNVTPSSIDFGTVPTSTTGNDIINATILNATNAITVSTAAPFSVSLDGNTYATSVTIPTPASLLNQTIFVAFNPTAATTYTGEVIISTTGAADTVALTGNGITCDVITTFPFTETFTDASSTVDCWQIVDANNDGNTFTINTEAGQVVYGYSSTNDANEYLISPEITLTSGLYGHIDYAVASNNYPEKFSIYVIPANGTLATATQIVPTQTVINTSFETQNFTFDAFANQTVRFAIKAESDADMYALGFTNFVIENLPNASIEADPNSMSFSTIAGVTSIAQDANVTAYSLTADIAISATAPFEVSTDGTTYGATATIPQASIVNCDIYVRYAPTSAGTHTGTVTLTSGSITATINVTGNAMDCSGVQSLPFVETFDNDLPSCWIILDEDGDGYTWESSTNPASYYAASVDLSGTGHNQSNGFILSGSYSNVLATALTPDNWLITPALAIPSQGATLSFFVSAQDASYANEHYGVYVSTTGTAVSDFTLLYEEDLDENGGPRAQGTWKEKIVNLPYGGQNIHIAIRHFNCTDMFLLNVDDFSVTPNTGVNEHESNVSIFPNPANNVINVNAASNINTVEVFNMMGQKVAAFDANNTSAQINTTALSNGMYMMRVTTENGVYNQKFTVAR